MYAREGTIPKLPSLSKTGETKHIIKLTKSTIAKESTLLSLHIYYSAHQYRDSSQ